MANSHTTSFTARRVAQQPSGSVFNWPGSSLLAAPLQKAWGDGKITKTEARQVARIIIEVRKEAAKRDADVLARRRSCSYNQIGVAPYELLRFPKA